MEVSNNIEEQVSAANNYMQFIMSLHHAMSKHQVTLAYEGEFNQQITKTFSALAEQKLDREEQNFGVRQRVFNVMVECLQNISKHGAATNCNNESTKEGIFVLGQDRDKYTITSGNKMLNKDIPNLRSDLTRLNAMSKDELKALYKKQIKEGRLSEKGGAGLGFIDIAKKTGRKFVFHFEPIDDETSFFLLKMEVLKT